MGIDIEMCVLPTESKIHEKLKAINQIEQYKIIHWWCGENDHDETKHQMLIKI